MSGRSAVLTRLGRAWRALPPEGRLAAFAALGLFLTMFLPWYQLNAVVDDDAGGRILGDNMNAFGVFTFVEAAVLLVAVAVLVLLFARAEGRSFHLPGGDGTVVMAAGCWVALLLVWRLFDKPDLSGDGVGNVGIQWGIFFALGAAGLLALAGSRMRAAHRPEPPLEVDRPRRPRPAAAGGPGTERTRVLPPDPPRGSRARVPRERRPAQVPPWEERPTEGVVERPAPRPSEREPVGDPPTERLPEPPTERLPEPPPQPPTRRTRERPDPQTERLFDEG